MGSRFFPLCSSLPLALRPSPRPPPQGVATGKYHAAVLTNSAEWEAACVKAGTRCGDLVHPLVYCPELHFSEFTSAVADMKNSVAVGLLAPPHPAPGAAGWTESQVTPTTGSSVDKGPPQLGPTSVLRMEASRTWMGIPHHCGTCLRWPSSPLLLTPQPPRGEGRTLNPRANPLSPRRPCLRAPRAGHLPPPSPFLQMQEEAVAEDDVVRGTWGHPQRVRVDPELAWVEPLSTPPPLAAERSPFILLSPRTGTTAPAPVPAFSSLLTLALTGLGCGSTWTSPHLCTP